MTDRIASTDAEKITANLTALLDEEAGEDEDLRAAAYTLAAVGRIDVLTDLAKLRRSLNGIRAMRRLIDRAVEDHHLAVLDAIADHEAGRSG